MPFKDLRFYVLNKIKVLEFKSRYKIIRKSKYIKNIVKIKGSKYKVYKN